MTWQNILRVTELSGEENVSCSHTDLAINFAMTLSCYVIMDEFLNCSESQFSPQKPEDDKYTYLAALLPKATENSW